jgi:lipopolysaccharide transport system ATP-binding protein
LFVSHNLTAVGNLCQKAVWLHGGRVVSIGPADDVISEYLRPENAATRFESVTYPDDADFRLLSAHLEQGENCTGPFLTSEPLDLHIRYMVKRPVKGLRIGMDVYTLEGMFLWRSFDDDMEERVDDTRLPATYHAVCRLPPNLFFPRQYVLSLAIGVQHLRWISLGKVQQTVEFYNINGVGSRYADEDHRAGALLMGLEWKTDTAADTVAPDGSEIVTPWQS